MNLSKWLIFPLIFAGLGIPASAQNKGTVVEEIVARVNNEIITREDLAKARMPRSRAKRGTIAPNAPRSRFARWWHRKTKICSAI